jgi:hypothetical protein
LTSRQLTAPSNSVSSASQLGAPLEVSETRQLTALPELETIAQSTVAQATAEPPPELPLLEPAPAEILIIPELDSQAAEPEGSPDPNSALESEGNLEPEDSPTPATPDVPVPSGLEPVPLPDPSAPAPPAAASQDLPAPTAPSPDAPTAGQPGTPPVAPELVELDADRQEYDTIRQTFTGEGNVEMRFRGGVLNADRIQVNLPNRTAVAEGNARLTRGDQLLVGERLTYNFGQTQGVVLRARGEVFIPSAGTDFGTAPPASDAIIPDPAIYGTGGLTIGLGNSGGSPSGGTVRRVRFEADRIDFTTDGWVATNVRLTNDPFSPPELELRSPTVTFTRLSPTRSEIRARNPQIVFDQGFRLPFLRNRVIIDERQRDPSLIGFGFDERERGGFYVEGRFQPLITPVVQLQVRPQIFVQRAFDQGSSFSDQNNFGLTAQLDAQLSPTTTLEANAVLTSLASETFNQNLRASIRARQLLGRHILSLEYSYRDRLFNGSLGYQNVQRSLGFVITSPQIQLGNTGLLLRYQAGAQAINANTDRQDLLEPIRDNNRINLSRFQASASLTRYFSLWQGQPLPATPEEGLRYSPNVLVPYILLVPSVRGVVGFYSNGDSQSTLTGSLGLYGQFGHFSRNFLDYTAFNVTYYQTAREGESPFLFDRDVDDRVISFGLVQQIYGPLRAGFQTSVNLDRDVPIDTDYILEYSRRTYSLTLRFNPVREVGSLGIRINDFNWSDDRGPFSGLGGTVQDGVQQPSN